MTYRPKRRHSKRDHDITSRAPSPSPEESSESPKSLEFRESPPSRGSSPSQASSASQSAPSPSQSQSPPPSTSSRSPRRGAGVWPPSSLVALGQFLRPHGVRGEARMFPYTKTAEELVENCPEKAILWKPNKPQEIVEIESLAAHQGIVLIALKNILDRDQAEGLRGAFLCIPEQERWSLPPNEYYVDDLTGVEVIDSEGGARLGTVRRVIDGGAHDYLEVELTDSTRTILIPFIREFVKEVNPAARLITAHFPIGLVDLNQAESDE